MIWREIFKWAMAIFALLLLLLLFVVICTVVGRAVGLGSGPRESCQGHGGVVKMGTDATNGRVPAYCKDGKIVVVDLQ